MFNLSKDEITFEVVQAFCSEWQEGVRVEYKQEITKDVPKIVSSFANTQGGIFIIGVKENEPNNEEPFTIVGIPNTGGIEERIVQSAITGIYPPVMPEVIIVKVPETENVIVIVRVDESHHAPHAIQNSTKVYIRHANITQPYEKPQLAQMDYIEYLLNRRQDAQRITQQIIERIKEAHKRHKDTYIPNLTIVAHPVFPYRPVISPPQIHDLYKKWDGMRRVPGGIYRTSDSSFAPTSEINEYGVVYYKTRFHENDPYPRINVIDFRDAIYEFMEIAKELYNNCDYLGNIEVSAQLQNVQSRNLSNEIGNLRDIQLPDKLFCSVPEFRVATSTYYLASDFKKPEHQKNIFEELILQMLWAFNIPSDNEHIIAEVRKLIEPAIK